MTFTRLCHFWKSLLWNLKIFFRNSNLCHSSKIMRIKYLGLITWPCRLLVRHQKSDLGGERRAKGRGGNTLEGGKGREMGGGEDECGERGGLDWGNLSFFPLISDKNKINFSTISQPSKCCIPSMHMYVFFTSIQRPNYTIQSSHQSC